MTMRGILLGCVSLLLCAAEPAGSIEGVVLNQRTGAPLRFAVVELERLSNTGPEMQRSTRTNSAGRWRFDKLPAGLYEISASRNGFLTEEDNPVQTPGEAVVEVWLKEGEQVSNQRIQLLQQSVIEGRLFDSDGEVLPGATAHLIRVIQCGALRYPIPAAQLRTNDEGVYRFHGLEPGNYAIAFQVDPRRRSQRRGRVERKAEDDQWTMRGTTWHPAAASLEQAAILRLQPGDGFYGLSSSALRQQSHSVSGRLLAPPGEGVGPVTLEPLVLGGLTSIDDPSGRADSEGRFRVDHVYPGLYRLQAQLGDKLSCESAVAVRASDVSNLVVDCVAPSQWSGRVLLDEGKTRTNRPTLPTLLLERADLRLDSIEKPLRVTVEAGGRFGPVTLPPGRYRVRASANSDWYLTDDSGHALYTKEVSIAGTQSRLELRMSRETAAIEGMVESNSRGVPATVVALPEGLDDYALLRYMLDTPWQVLADQSGYYQFRGLPPGAYRIYAFQRMQVAFDLKTPFVTHRNKAAEVTLRGGDRRPLRLNRIEMLP
jgi:5-hydroxyisourate hydrolase-like protein (transthyretin family)